MYGSNWNYNRDEDSFIFSVTNKTVFKIKDPDRAVICNVDGGDMEGISFGGVIWLRFSEW
jgi:hypothetical protein